MLCAIWYFLHNLKNVKNTHGCFARFLNCTNGTKSRNASYRCFTKKIYEGIMAKNVLWKNKFYFIFIFVYLIFNVEKLK